MRAKCSFDFRAGKLDDFGPFVDFFGDEPAEAGGRHRHRQVAEGRELRTDPRIAEACSDFHIELVDQLSGRVLWRADAKPDAWLRSLTEIRRAPARPEACPIAPPWLRQVPSACRL